MFTSSVGAATFLAWGLAAWLPQSRLRWTALVDVIAASLIFLIPLAVGGVFRILRRWSLPAEIGLRYLVGNLTLVGLAAILELFGEFSVSLLTTLALVTTALGPVLATVIYSLRTPWGRIRLPAISTLIWAVGVAAVSLGAVFFWRVFSPPPFQPVWDGLLHATVANAMGDGNFSLLLGDFTDAFSLNAYLPGHHLRLAMTSSLTDVDVLHLQWGAPFVFSLVMGLGIYVLVKRHSAPPVAFFAASLAPFLQFLTKSPSIVISFLPASEAVAITPFVLAPLLLGRGGRSWLWSVLLAVLALPIHAIHGSLLLATLGCAAVIQAALARWNRARLVAAAGAVIALALMFASDLAALLPEGLLLDPGGAYGDVTPSADLQSRFKLLARFLPEAVAGASILGATLWLAAKPAAFARFAAVALAAGVLYVIPIPGLERLHGVLVVTIPVAVGYLIVVAGDAFGQVSSTRWKAAGATSIAAPVVVLMLLLPILGRPLAEHRDRQLTDTDLVDVASSFADYELETLSELRGTFDGAQALSDPITQSMLEAFAGADTPGGPFHPVPTRDSLQLALIGNAAEAGEALHDLQQLHGDPFRLVISGRTLWWANQRGVADNSVFRPRHLSLLPRGRVSDDKADILRRLGKTDCVDAVDDQGEIVILTVSCR